MVDITHSASGGGGVELDVNVEKSCFEVKILVKSEIEVLESKYVVASYVVHPN